MRQASDEPCPDRIAYVAHDDRNHGGRVLSRVRCRRAGHENEVYLATKKVIGEARKSLDLSTRKPVLDDEVSMLDPSEIPQPLTEDLEARGVRGRGRGGQNADPGRRPCLGL